MTNIYNKFNLDLYVKIKDDCRVALGLSIQAMKWPVTDKRVITEPLTPSNVVVVDRTRPIGDKGPMMYSNPTRLIDWTYYDAEQFYGVKLSAQTIVYRMKNGWSTEEIFTYDTNERPPRFKTDNHIYEIHGERKSFSEWCEEYDTPMKTVRYRMLRNKMSLEEALVASPTKRGAPAKMYEYNGESHSISEWSEITGIPGATIRQRIYNGWAIGDALTVPIVRSHRQG